MAGTDRHDLVVVGGGTAGLVGAIGAATTGARVLLAEEHRTGGDCLWTGCVPSKSLVAAARRAHDLRTADAVGLPPVEPDVDLGRVMDRVHEAIAILAPHDSPDRLEREGVEVVPARARFVAPGRIDVGGRSVAYRAALVATGSRPSLPDVEGLATAEALTTDTLWDLRVLPDHLLVLGAGPVGVELAQAFRRLGSRVTLVEAATRILPDVDADAAAVVAERLSAEGVDVRTATRPTRVRDGVLTATRTDGRGVPTVDRVAFDRLLVATGRTPRTDDLGLASVGVDLDAAGHVVVDDTMATTGDHVWAAGDVTGTMPFTHVAAAQGGLVVTNALFRLRRRFRPERIPWTIFTDPEVAHVGMTESAARARWGDAAVVRRHDVAEVDRAVTGAVPHGFAKLVASPRGRLVGATVVGEAAGEAIAEQVAWVSTGASLTTMAAATHAYPTMAEGPWTAAVDHLRDTVSRPGARMVLAPVLAGLRRVDHADEPMAQRGTSIVVVSPPHPLTRSRPSTVTSSTSSGITRSSRLRVNGCSPAWSWSSSRTPSSVPSGARTRNASA